MTLQDYQLQIGTTDLVIGAETDYIVHGWEGLGVPELRTSDQDKPFDHGTFLGPEYLSARTIAIESTVRGADATEAVANLDALTQAWYFDARAGVADFEEYTTLTVKLPGVDERQLRGRPRRMSADSSRIITGKSTATLEFYAADPRWYGATVHQQVLNLATASTGFSFSRSFDYGFGGGDSGTEQITNAGNMGTSPTVRINGPITNVTITNETTGKSLVITYTLLTGEYLEIDFAAKTVMLGGTASRYYAKSGDWWELEPGANDVRMSATAGTGTATLSWQDAWL